MRCVIEHHVITRAFQHAGKARQRAGHGPVTWMRKCPCLANTSIGLGTVIILQAVQLDGDDFSRRDIWIWIDQFSRAGGGAETQQTN